MAKMTFYKTLRIATLIFLSMLFSHHMFAMKPKRAQEIAEREERKKIIDKCNEHIDACRKRGEDLAATLKRIEALAAATQEDIADAQE